MHEPSATRPLLTREIWRWVLAACAVVAVFFGTLYLGIFILFSESLPKESAETVAGFLMVATVTLSGSVLVPKHQLLTSVVLYALTALFITFLLHMHPLGAVAGGLLVAGWIAWRFHSRRNHPSRLSMRIAAGTGFTIFIALGYAQHVDLREQPDKLAIELTHALDADASRISAFYHYDLGGFIDQQSLWRIDAEPEVIAQIVSALELQSTQVVPQRFWRMPPHYWPHSMPAGAGVLQSRQFPTDDRGADGPHYFMVHDKKQKRAFVWFKSNF